MLKGIVGEHTIRAVVKERLYTICHPYILMKLAFHVRLVSFSAASETPELFLYI